VNILLNQLNATFSNLSFVEDLSHFLSPAGKMSSNFPRDGNTEKCFILLHTGRCGSTLLHYYLKAANVCPPFEIFNPQAADPILQVLNQRLPVDIGNYVEAYRKMMLRGNLNHPSAVVSYSLCPWSLLWVVANAPEIVEWLFRGAHVLLLSRKNLIRQAVSYATAIARGKWHSFDTKNDHVKQPDQSEKLKMVAKYVDMILWAENTIVNCPLVDLLKSASSVRSISYECLIENSHEVTSMILNDLGIVKSKNTNEPSSELPIRLERSDNLYNDFMNQLPRVLPSGFELNQSTLYNRMID
jgi:LPS sulfotransferase NodH